MPSFRLPVRFRIYSIVALSFIGLIGLAIAQQRNLASFLMEQKRTELGHLAQLAHGIAQEEYDKAGESSDGLARQKAAHRISKLRYGADDYFWINDLEPRMIMHPYKPELNGEDLSGVKDSEGKRLFVEFVEVVKSNGAGFVDYLWPKPGKDQPQPKVSHVTGFAPWGWVIGTGVYVDDLEAQVWRNTKAMAAATTIVVGVIGAITLVLARTITAALTAMNHSVTKLGQGDFDIELPGIRRYDELGDMARSIMQFKVQAVARSREESAARAERDNLAAERRKQEMHDLAIEFESMVGEIIESVSVASADLEGAASRLTSTAEHSRELATTVVSISEESSSNVQTVASAADDLTTSVNEVGRQVQHSASMATEAVDQAQKTDHSVKELSQATARIGDVADLINKIAGQTNLLALNATIEAARAGPNGRGFAVVASEVKALAQQTATATTDIRRQIDGVQIATAEAVNAIGEIVSMIGKMSGISANIAAAVEQQGATTVEIARNVQSAARGTLKVSANFIEVQRGASETGAASSNVLLAAKSLSADSERLKLGVGEFLQSIKRS